MKATTIKLDGELLRDLESAKPKDQSVTAYVRDVLRKELQRMVVREAAEEYQAFVSDEKAEKKWLQEWDDADLSSEPTKKSPRRNTRSKR
jgi:hypothetical protein